eukprot:CAMPEP_0185718324 /NCGR_PEP_ID=MMETSP1164-20130828/46516_1 /TAXON_ID=1104430 /ORGANISM="Chrysoreinhardia sp, Strain CCMP2950" /LENGTH=307 /DNA_ID=CAMNT_0028385965 /DNA_START=33 /DNA_END=953 /DNA_ORIENTATION=-
MTRMRPSYERIDVPPFDAAPAYGLVRYREKNRRVPPRDATPNRTAVLFVPGNGGSFEQVRSLGSRVALETYAVDTAGELAAFDPRVASRQVRFVRRCVRALTREHDGVLLVGHSIGGVVAAEAAASSWQRRIRQSREDGYKKDASEKEAAPMVRAVLTLAAPHAGHPFLLGGEASQSLTAADEQQTALIMPVVVSLSGGPRDWQVPDWLATASRAVPVAHASTRRVAGVSVDHQCALWCRELVEAVAAALEVAATTTAWTPAEELLASLLAASGGEPHHLSHDATERPSAATLSAAWPFVVEAWRDG